MQCELTFTPVTYGPMSSSPQVPFSGQIVTRFAPSPTGHLHIGGARTALFCWAFAKRFGGSFVLRIEDTDRARSSVESARGIMEDLAWLGIEWNEGPELVTESGKTIGGDPRHVGPFFQAQRVHLYDQYINWLVENEKAYPAFDTTEEVDAMRKAVTDRKGTFRYDRTKAISIPKSERIKRMNSGEPHVIRLIAPEHEIVVHDSVLGDVKYAAGEADDFVLRKADGFPTYHFAVVIDDELMGVTHIMRAQEHLNNTPRHVALQMALCRVDTGVPFRRPEYAHMPLIFNMDGSKMSKRDKAKVARMALKQAISKDASLKESAASKLGLDSKLVSDFIAADNDSIEVAERIAHHFAVVLPEIEVSDFRENGYTPEAIINFLGLLGWNPGMKLSDGKDLEKFDMKFLSEHFSVERIGKTNAKFDRVKLASFNGDVIASMSVDDFAMRWAQWCAVSAPALLARVGLALNPTMGEIAANQRWHYLASAVKQRAKTFSDALKPAGFLLSGDLDYKFDAAAVEKNLRANDQQGLRLLREFSTRLAQLPVFEPKPIHDLIETMVKEQGLANMGPIAQAVRVAIAGVAVSPPLGESLAVLGKESSLARIGRCLKECGGA